VTNSTVLSSILDSIYFQLSGLKSGRDIRYKFGGALANYFDRFTIFHDPQFGMERKLKWIGWLTVSRMKRTRGSEIQIDLVP
jgi:hypothetical protein